MLVLGILKLTGVLSSNNFVKSAIFNIVTLLGATWIITDFIWGTFSKRRRGRICYLDKMLHLPLGIYLITFDILSLINWNKDTYFGILQNDWFKYGVSLALLYIAVDYTFEGIYHHFKPTPDMLRLKEEMEKEEAEKLLEEKKDNNDGQTNA